MRIGVRSLPVMGLLRPALAGLAMTMVCFGDSPVWAGQSPKLSAEDKLYRAKCTSCHRLLKPKDYTDEEWEEAVKKYGKKLSDEEREKMLEFLQGSN